MDSPSQATEGAGSTETPVLGRSLLDENALEVPDTEPEPATHGAVAVMSKTPTELRRSSRIKWRPINIILITFLFWLPSAGF